MTYRITKHYGHERGLSCVFRQWRADSHCSKLHGYALAVEITLESDFLDACNWVFDFGKFKPIEAWLKETFDHTLLVAQDDPQLDDLTMLEQLGIARVIVVNSTGCEKFAEMIGVHIQLYLAKLNENRRVRLVSVKVSEHGSNSATFLPVRV